MATQLQRLLHRTWILPLCASFPLCTPTTTAFACQRCAKYFTVSNAKYQPGKASIFAKLSIVEAGQHRYYINNNNPEACEDELDASEMLRRLEVQDALRLKVIRLEYEFWQYEGHSVPHVMTADRWLRLVQRGVTSEQRLSLLQQWKRQDDRQSITEETKKQKAKTKPESRLKKPHYAPVDSRYILYERKRRQMHALNQVRHAMQFGPDLVVDCGYVNQMTGKEQRALVGLLVTCISVNMYLANPCHLHLCNFPIGSEFETEFIRRENLPKMSGEPLGGAYTILRSSYLDVFPQHELIYLTDDARDDLEEVNLANNVYIVGGLVPAMKKSLASHKAKAEGVRLARLPLEVVSWEGNYSKDLPLEVTLRILHRQHDTGNWKQSLCTELPFSAIGQSQKINY